ncbi:MAG: type I restriction enzyme HsdR N-terminal domain-containing protein [Bacteroidales bacterium]|nr:type I restriction enzyme HsdR N-terminal domain-containing protein [Bacteroidales bacterium]
MEGKATIWDPLRKKNVALTPEERVRQWCIGILSGSLGVPMHMMMSEAAFSLGKKRYRADILIYDRKVRPLAVVECKRPEVVLDREVLDQAVRYNMVLNVKYIIITNGVSTFSFRRESGATGKYVPVFNVPEYGKMLEEQACDDACIVRDGLYGDNN